MKKITTLLLLLFTFQLFAQIDKVEPPFWYENMTYNQVQILFYGKNIAQNSVTVSNGVVITEVQKTENPNYVFVTIDTKNVTALDLIFTFKNGKKAFTQKYSIKKRKENSRNRKSYDSSDMMYLIMPDRFANGNEKNDSSPILQEKDNRNNPGGRHGGDIQGIINKNGSPGMHTSCVFALQRKMLIIFQLSIGYSSTRNNSCRIHLFINCFFIF